MSNFLQFNHEISDNNNSLQEIADFVKKSGIKHLLMANVYEELIPFNLWFKHASLKVRNCRQHRQDLRLRYWDSRIITPLISTDNSVDNLEHLRNFLHLMTLYQPFYPETFFIQWEFLQLGHIHTIQQNENGFFLTIGAESQLGNLEALMFYHERYQLKYHNNRYDAWITGNELFDNAGHCYMDTPTRDYLGQNYPVRFVLSSRKLRTYHFIIIDCLHIMDSVSEWRKQEKDLQACLFYLHHAMQHLVEQGSILIKINLIAHNSWSLLMSLASKVFRECVIHRPSISNPFNPEVYLFLHNFNSDAHCAIDNHYFYTKLYAQKVYHIMHINSALIIESSLWSKFCLARNDFIGNLKGKMRTIPDRTRFLTQWHAVNDLDQIGKLHTLSSEGDFVDEIPIRHEGQRTHAVRLAINILLSKPEHLYSNQAYVQISRHRSRLNYFKRIMDTKPSSIHLNHKSHDLGPTEFLMWERVKRDFDFHAALKSRLDRQFGVEILTNAWFKMFEILHKHPDLLPKKDRVKTFSLCEAPGAFISALNQYTHDTNRHLDWYAQSLKPSIDNAALEDHYGLINTYPERWIFGDSTGDNSGDITHSTIIKYYSQNMICRDLDFMTSDAGLVCEASQLNEQESCLAKINMGQIVCILACLPVGKCAMFKTFLPMDQPLTLSLMYLVNRLFESVIVSKPEASHAANSEIYIIMKKYRGIDRGVLDILYALLDDPKITSETCLFSEFDSGFLNIYSKIMCKFICKQIACLCRYYSHYYKLINYREIADSKRRFVERWFRNHHITPLSRRLLIGTEVLTQQIDVATTD